MKDTIATVTGSLSRDSSQDAAFWESMANTIDVRKLQMWDALIESFSKYQ